MLQLIDICKQFQDGSRTLTVLDHLDLTIESGDFVAIQGESGAGKTTLLSILGTMLMPDSGRYLLDGQEVLPDQLAHIRNHQIGFVYQDHRLLPQFTALQNILLPLLAEKYSNTFDEVQYALQLMDFMGIQNLKDSPVNVLSGGEQTRVAICRALVCRPSLLLADEPTGQLDARNSETIAQLFQKINRELHVTIVMVTHSGHMAQMAQQTLVLAQGKIGNPQ